MSRELRELIEKAAKGNERTLTAEICDRLEKSFSNSVIESDLNATVRILMAMAKEMRLDPGKVLSEADVVVVTDETERKVVELFRGVTNDPRSKQMLFEMVKTVSAGLASQSGKG
ncbi:MAG: Arc family DNA-binding protein [Magnetococcales bacterium]|nr:Arc family DNA-binding protein [Magnetococcales bacterium]